MAQSTQYTGRSDTAADLKNKATDQIRKTADRVEDFAASAATQAQELGGRVQEVAGNVKGAVDKSLKDQPMATLAVAAMVGFVLGALWKS